MKVIDTNISETVTLDVVFDQLVLNDSLDIVLSFLNEHTDIRILINSLYRSRLFCIDTFLNATDEQKQDIIKLVQITMLNLDANLKIHKGPIGYSIMQDSINLLHIELLYFVWQILQLDDFDLRSYIKQARGIIDMNNKLICFNAVHPYKYRSNSIKIFDDIIFEYINKYGTFEAAFNVVIKTFKGIDSLASTRFKGSLFQYRILVPDVFQCLNTISMYRYNNTYNRTYGITAHRYLLFILRSIDNIPLKTHIIQKLISQQSKSDVVAFISRLMPYDEYMLLTNSMTYEEFMLNVQIQYGTVHIDSIDLLIYYFLTRQYDNAISLVEDDDNNTNYIVDLLKICEGLKYPTKGYYCTEAAI